MIIVFYRYGMNIDLKKSLKKRIEVRQFLWFLFEIF